MVDGMYITFEHALYGKCVLLRNTRFKTSENPSSICFKPFNKEMTGIWDSSLTDAGLIINPEILKQLGY